MHELTAAALILLRRRALALKDRAERRRKAKVALVVSLSPAFQKKATLMPFTPWSDSDNCIAGSFSLFLLPQTTSGTTASTAEPGSAGGAFPWVNTPPELPFKRGPYSWVTPCHQIWHKQSLSLPLGGDQGHESKKGTELRWPSCTSGFGTRHLAHGGNSLAAPQQPRVWFPQKF